MLERIGNCRIIEEVGAGGMAQTLLAPTGIAYAGGEAWSARSRSGEITPGTPIRVVEVKGLELIVEPTTTEKTGSEHGDG